MNTADAKSSSNPRSRLVIGLGTGRCGTMSLAKLLDLQLGWSITHERLAVPMTWHGASQVIERKISQWLRVSTGVVGDVAFYYLPYVRGIRDRCPTAKFICLERDRDEVIESFLRTTRGRNHWQPYLSSSNWQADVVFDKLFPKYSGAIDKAEAVGRYWDDYHREATRLQEECPSVFRRFSLATLNYLEGVREVLTFAGVSEDRQNVTIGIHANSTK